MDRTRTTAHGRDEIRRLKAVTVPHLPFPHAGQALQIVRRRRTVRTGKVSLERVYAVTSLMVHQATPADLAKRVRGHWAIENREHHVRDVTLVRTPPGCGPAVRPRRWPPCGTWPSAHSGLRIRTTSPRACATTDGT